MTNHGKIESRIVEAAVEFRAAVLAVKKVRSRPVLDYTALRAASEQAYAAKEKLLATTEQLAEAGSREPIRKEGQIK